MRKVDALNSATPSIQVIERIFTLIDVLSSREEAVSLKEISEKSGLHPSTAHRILNDLACGRFVDRPEAGSYRLGMRLLELGNLVKARLDVRDAALGPMLRCAMAQGLVSASLYTGRWTDVGTPERLAQLNLPTPPAAP